ncbi:MAG TPA: cytochrome c [Gaiellaceae bacterium]|jgi:mono/diheme cytochrome c family protein
MFSFAPTLAALSTSHEIGLAAVAAAFIVFALVSSFVIPARFPNFPGRGMAGYVVLVIAFFLAFMAAVLVLGKERPEAAEPPRVTTNPAPIVTTQKAPTTTAKSGGASSGGGTVGDPAAGKAVFASAGCTGCHTLKAAGATGNVGPNLDQLKPSEAAVAHQVENGGGAMPAFKGQLSQQQIQDVAAFVYASTH